MRILDIFFLMKRTLLFCLSCLLLLQVKEGLAQTYPFKNYTIESGLPQSTVYHAYQDKKGYVWAGTQGGVCRFDGREFKVWNATSGLPDNHVTSIHESPEETLWFGHRSGRLSFLKKNKLHKFKHANYTNGAYVEIWMPLIKILFLKVS